MDDELYNSRLFHFKKEKNNYIFIYLNKKKLIIIYKKINLINN